MSDWRCRKKLSQSYKKSWRDTADDNSTTAEKEDKIQEQTSLDSDDENQGPATAAK